MDKQKPQNIKNNPTSNEPVEESFSGGLNAQKSVKPNLLSGQLGQTPTVSASKTSTGLSDQTFAKAAGATGTSTAVKKNNRFNSRLFGVFSGLGLLLLASLALLLIYNGYHKNYQKLQSSKVQDSYGTTSLDLSNINPLAPTTQTGLLVVNGDADVTNNLTAGSFTGNGSGLSSVNAQTLNNQPGSYYLNASNINAGTLGDQYLSGNVALLNANQTFTGNNTFSGSTTATGNITTSGTNTNSGTNNFTGSVSLPGAITINANSYNFPASQATGSLTNDGSGNLYWQPAGACPTCVNNGGNSYGAAMSIGTNDNNNLSLITNGVTRLTFDTTGNATFTGAINGNGSGITNLNATNLSSGTVVDARLSANVALLNSTQNFTGNKTFSGGLILPGTITINSNSYNFPVSSAAGVLVNDGSGNLSWGSSGACPTCITNGGNTFGAPISIGTNDNNNLIFKTNGVTRLTFDTIGNATFTGSIYGDGTHLTGVAKLALDNQTFTGNHQVFQNTANSTSAFVVNNAGANSVLTVDTLNSQVVAPNITTNNITPTSTMTIGSSSQQLSLQGSAASTLVVSGGGKTTTIGFTGTPSANLTYNFDRTAVGGPWTICTTAGNCAGVSGSVGTGGGTAGKLAKFTAAYNIADSIISDSGTQATIGGSLEVDGALKVMTNSPNYLTLSSYGASVTSGSGTTTYTLPAATPLTAGNTYDVCTNSGNCFGSGGSGANTGLSNLSNVAINTSLLPALAASASLGSNSKPFQYFYLAGSSTSPDTNNFQLTGNATSPRTITFPDYNGTICTTNDTISQVCSGYANNTLSNLGTVALNSVLQPATAGSLSLGVTTLPFSDLYLAGSSATPATNRFKITGTSTGGLRVITLPDNEGTVCLQNSTSCGFALSSGSGAAFVNGGNAFGTGTTATLGTNDNTALAFKTNNTPRFTIDSASSTMTGNGATKYTGSGAIDVQSTDTTANISIGSNATSGIITIGGGAQTGDINVGVITPVSGVGQNVNIGYGNAIQVQSTWFGAAFSQISIGSSTTTNTYIGNLSNGSISMGAAMTSGSINIGGTGASGVNGAIDIGVGTGQQTISLGTGSGNKYVRIGSSNNASASTLIRAGTTGGIDLSLNGTTFVSFVGSPGNMVFEKNNAHSISLADSTSGGTAYGLSISGSSGSSPATSNTAGSAGGTLTFTAGIGGAPNGAALSGDGGSLTLNGGASGLSSTSNGGGGGAVNINGGSSANSYRSGAGGAVNIAAGSACTTCNNGGYASGANGTGGVLNFTSGNGGNSDGILNSNLGGNGGAITITIGNGGKGGTPTNSAGIYGGNAGNFSIVGGTGGAGAGSSGNGGAGSSISFTAGSGGAASGTGTAGAAGVITANSSTTAGAAFTINANNIIGGKALAISSSSSGITTAGSNIGSMLDIQTTGGSTAFTGSLANISFDGNNAGNTGALLNIYNSGANSKVQSLLVTNNQASAVTNGLIRFNFSGASRAGIGLEIDDTATTGTTMQINSNSLTSGTGLAISANGINNASGVGLSVSSSTSSATSFKLVNISLSNTSNTGTALYISNPATANTSSLALEISGQTKITTSNLANTAALTIANVNTNTGISFSGSLTTGTAINVQAPTASGTGIIITTNASSLAAGYNGLSMRINPTRTFTTTGLTSTGNELNINRSNVVNVSGGTTTITGDMVSFTSNCTQTLGTCTDSSSILSLNQSYASATGPVLSITNSGTGTGLLLTANNLAGGSGLVISTTAAAQTGTSLLVTTGSTSTPAAGLVRFNFNGTRTSASNAFQIDDQSTTLATTMAINSNQLTSGLGLVVTTNLLTSGKAVSVASSSTGLTGNLVDINATGTGNTGTSLNVTNSSSSSSAFALNVSGQVQITTPTNSTSAFSVKNLSSSSILTVDTINSRVGINTNSPTAQLSVVGTTLTDSPTLGSELSSTWTANTGWTGSGSGTAGSYTHTAASGTATLVNAYKPTSLGTKYQVQVTISGRTAGSINLSMGGQNLSYLGSFSTNGVSSWAPTNTDTASFFTIIPTTDFDGTISAVTIKQITSTSTPVVNFSSSNSSTNKLEFRLPAATGSTAVGANALAYRLPGSDYSSAFGNNALQNLTGGSNNSAFGYSALQNTTVGYFNSAFGGLALTNNTTAPSNSAFGWSSLTNLNSGQGNTAIGAYSGAYIDTSSTALTTANFSTYLGYNTKGTIGDNNTTVIGYNAISLGANTTVIGNSSTVTSAIFGKLGIGTTAPSTKLQVTGTTLTDSPTIGNELNSSAAWTPGSGWTGSGSGTAGSYTHTAASGTADLVSAYTPANSTRYQVQVVTNARTAGSITLSMGGQTTTTAITSNTTTTWGPLTTSTAQLTITPTTDFDGTVTSVSVKQITTASSPVVSFTSSDSTTNKLEFRVQSNNALAVGTGGLQWNTTGVTNAAFGNTTLSYNTTGSYNTAIGNGVMYSNTAGSQNTAIGQGSMGPSTGDNNTAVGQLSLGNMASGSGNTAIGVQAGHFTAGLVNVTNIGTSVFLGAFSRALNASGDTNEIVIGNGANGVGTNSVVLGNDSITKTILKGKLGSGTTSPSVQLDVLSTGADATSVAQFKNAGATTCAVTPGGTGFACSSDARLKTNVLNIANASDIVSKLQGVSFNWTSNPDGQSQIGFIGQDLQKLIPSAVSTDSNGFLVANYSAVIPYLVEAFKTQQAQIDTLNSTSLDVLKTLSSSNAVVLGGDLTVNGNVIVQKSTTFNGNVTFNSDTAGTATIPAGDTKVHVGFSKPLPAVPTVSATPKDFIDGSYKVSGETTYGFDIELQKSQVTPVIFNWQEVISK